MPIHLARGPKTDDVTKKVAEEQLRAHPNSSNVEILEVWDDKGYWTAALRPKVAEFPPAKDDGGDEGESAPPKDEGGESEGPPSDDGPSEDGGEGPPKEHGDGPPKEKGGEAGELKQLLHMVTLLTQALGIEPGGIGPADGMGPGVGPEGPPPPGPPGPPHGEHGGPAGPDQVVQHQRATKPGEAPPGVTPIGTPAFASNVPDSHPWKEQIGKAASFTVSNEIPENVTLASVDMELQRLAYNTRCPELPGGFKVKQVTEGRDGDGRRVAKALISAY